MRRESGEKLPSKQAVVSVWVNIDAREWSDCWVCVEGGGGGRDIAPVAKGEWECRVLMKG